MDLMAYLVEPVIFFPVLAGLAIIAIFAMRSLKGDQQILKKTIEAEQAQNKEFVTGLQDALGQKEKELEEKKTLLEKIEKDSIQKAEITQKQIKDLQAQSAAKEQQIKADIAKAQAAAQAQAAQQTAQITQLQTQIKEKDELINKNTATLEEAVKKVKSLDEQMQQLKSELTLKEQMYQGLKSQYDELEKSAEKMYVEPKQDKKEEKSEAPAKEEKEPQNSVSPAENKSKPTTPTVSAINTQTPVPDKPDLNKEKPSQEPPKTPNITNKASTLDIIPNDQAPKPAKPDVSNA